MALYGIMAGASSGSKLKPGRLSLALLMIFGRVGPTSAVKVGESFCLDDGEVIAVNSAEIVFWREVDPAFVSEVCTKREFWEDYCRHMATSR